jgi:hypothetical protein
MQSPKLPPPTLLLISMCFSLLGGVGLLSLLIMEDVAASTRIKACIGAGLVLVYFATVFVRETRYRARYFDPAFEDEYFRVHRLVVSGAPAGVAIERLSSGFTLIADQPGIGLHGLVRVIDFRGIHAEIRIMVRENTVDEVQVNPAHRMNSFDPPNKSLQPTATAVTPPADARDRAGRSRG